MKGISGGLRPELLFTVKLGHESYLVNCGLVSGVDVEFPFSFKVGGVKMGVKGANWVRYLCERCFPPGIG